MNYLSIQAALDKYFAPIYRNSHSQNAYGLLSAKMRNYEQSWGVQEVPWYWVDPAEFLDRHSVELLWYFNLIEERNSCYKLLRKWSRLMVALNKLERIEHRTVEASSYDLNLVAIEIFDAINDLNQSLNLYPSHSVSDVLGQLTSQSHSEVRRL